MKKIRDILCNNQNKYCDWGIGVIFTLLGFVALGVCIYHGLGEDIWFDEVFSVKFMEHGYAEIAKLTSVDVHPPMYYWYLKTFHDISKWIMPSASSVVLCKMTSVLPFLGILMLVPFLLAGYSNMQGFYAEENKKIVAMESTREFLDTFDKDAVVLCNFNHVQALGAYYLSEETPVYLYGGVPESLIAELLPNCRSFEDTDTIKELVEANDVYFFGSFDTREELLAEWELEGIHYTEEGTYLLERYYFNVYHLYDE